MDTTDTAGREAQSGAMALGPGGGRSGRVRVLILRSGALGDFVLTLPVLSQVRRSFPRAEVTLVTRSGFGRLALASGLADRIVSEDSPEVVWLYSDAGEGGRTFREAHGAFDLALSFVLSPNVRRNLLAAGVAALSERAPRPHPSSGLHAADHLFAVMDGLARGRNRAVPKLTFTNSEDRPNSVDRARVEAVLREHGLAAGRYLAVHPGSGSPRKNWPLERFVDLARRAREDLGLNVVVLTGPAEAERRQEIEGAFGGAFLHSPDLVALAGVLARSAAYVGNDSGVTHLAAAAGARTVAVFGPTDPGVWAPRGERVRVARHESGEIERVGVEEVVALLQG